MFDLRSIEKSALACAVVAVAATPQKANRVAEEERVRREALAAEVCSLRAEAQVRRQRDARTLGIVADWSTRHSVLVQMCWNQLHGRK